MIGEIVQSSDKDEFLLDITETAEYKTSIRCR